MIVGIGVDLVEINRFTHWGSFSRKKLLRIFSEQEIDYCLQQPNKSAERFAVRFAAREAFFKAFSAAYPHRKIPFLTLCKAISVSKQDSRPALLCDWPFLLFIDTAIIAHLSLTHTSVSAMAFVVLEGNK